MTDAPRARELARAALTLEASHGRDLAATLAPLVAAIGADESALRAVLQDAADAPDDGAALTVFATAAAPVPVLPEPLTGDGWNTDPPPREWLVDGWLPAGELVLLSGPGFVGKGQEQLGGVKGGID